MCVFSTRAVEAVPERVVNSVADWANAAALVKRLLSNKYTCIFQALCDFTRSRPCSRTRSTAASIAEGVITNCSVRARYYTRDTAVGRPCGEGTRLRHWICAQDGILTGRGLHKLPLPPSSAALPCSQSQQVSRPARVSDYEPQSASSLSSLTPEVLPCTAVVETFFFPSQPQLRN